MEQLQPTAVLPFLVGALYNRKNDIHGLLGGQQQGGISTPANSPFVIIFTGEAGKSHGYGDFWDESGIFHYFGEGQSGDMKMAGGNSAINNHVRDGKHLLVFKSLGHGKPYRFDGEFVNIGAYIQPDTPATRGPNRNAIVFRLGAITPSLFLTPKNVSEQPVADVDLDATTALKLTAVRTKQDLFRRRLIDVEKQCRLTKVMDLRFLRASHIKPWPACETGSQRTDGNNGLLLTPHADLLFDKGWITFCEKGRLCVSKELPQEIKSKIGLNLKDGRNCGSFNEQQDQYLEFHRNKIFGRKYRRENNPLEELIQSLAN